MSTAGTIETIHQFLTAKYPGVFLLLIASSFGWFTTSRLNDLGGRVDHIETVELPGIHQDIKEMRQDIKNLEIRVTTLEVKVKNMETTLDELTVEVKELRGDVKDILLILTKKGP